MNIEFFGLDRMPFQASRDIYAGPQQLALAGGLKRALSSPDSIVTISGPAGVGKTVTARHAIQRTGTAPAIARIGRVYLRRDEILEQLLDEFNVRQMPASSLQRFNALKRLLTGWAGVGTRVFVIVEDAERLGEEALAELESLTAGDGDETPGAHLILLGTPGLSKFLQRPLLARLRQRVRRSFSVDPYAAEETRGYLRHCLGTAGASLGDIFADPVVDLVHEASGGIARMINTLAESLMEAAEHSGEKRIELAFAGDVLRSEFDWKGVDDADRSAGAKPDDTASGSAAPAAPEAAASAIDVEDIPALIQDTQPRMPALDPDMATPAAAGSRQRGDTAASQPLPRAEELAALREKTDATQPSLPVLSDPDGARPAPGADAPGAEEPRMRLEPRAPEPLSKTADPADTQTLRALDDALRPDTQLLKTLEEPTELESDDSPVPIGLRAEVAKALAEAPDTHADTLPTLSDTVLLESQPQFQQAPPKQPEAPAQAAAPVPRPRPAAAPRSTAEMQTIKDDEKTVPSVDPSDTPCSAGQRPAASRDGLATANPGLADSDRPTPARAHAPAPAGRADRPVPEANAGAGSLAGKAARPDPKAAAGNTGDDVGATQTRGPGVQPTRSTKAPQPGDQPAADAGNELPDLTLVPEITLDDALEKQQQEAQARLEEEARRNARMKSESDASDRQSAAAAAAAKQDAGNTQARDAGVDAQAQKRKLEALAAHFENARSIEDIVDDTAAETLFGEEFSQMAEAVATMHKASAAQETVSAADAVAAPEAASNDAALTLEEPAAKAPTEPARQTAAPQTVSRETASSNAAARPTRKAQPAGRPAEPPGRPSPAVARTPAAPQTPSAAAQGAMDSSAAQRLEMVRKLNAKAGRPVPDVPTEKGEEIVLGGNSRSSATSTMPKPDRIEDQFGTSMTATLNALSAENIKKMRAEEEREEKKRGLLARFRRS
jgi:type II secretory pathway predicted ATPase ExeA